MVIEDQEYRDTWLLLIEKILDWPFLAFVVVLLVIALFRSEVATMLKSRQISVEVGGNKLSIGEAVEEIEQTTAEDLLKLQERLRRLESQATTPRIPEKVKSGRGEAEPSGAEPPPAAAPPEDQADRIWPRVRRELLDSKFVWRSLDRLALAAAVAPETVHEVLSDHQDEVKIGRGKSGRIIARHLTREPK